MGIVYTRTENGLLVPERNVPGREVAAALQRYDPDLALELSVSAGRPLWKVVRPRGDKEAETVLVWAGEHGEPLPLSMGILEMVRRHDRNTRARMAGMDEENRRLAERRRQDADEAVDESARETGRAATRGLGHFSGPVPRSQALAVARRKGRRTGRAA